ncbi:MAG TPA: rod shape-determining protein MreC [Caulobacteraceae bacterium]|jgi:rod shape-determining protein MreC|nr:rod shape-determining protein MreC [Caulobacteraceae bacterium]
MSLRDGSLGEMKPPLKWLAAAALVVAAAIAFAVFAGVGGRGAEPVRTTFEAGAGTVTGALAAPVRGAGGLVGAVSAYLDAGAQNRRLKAQLAAARALVDQNAALRDENTRLRELLGVRTDPPLPMVAARTILDARGPFSNARLDDAGAAQGVAEGNPVLSAHGLVGRIAGVGGHISRIVLLTDPDSRVPVLIGRTNGRAILTGDGGAEPRLDYLRTHDQVREGDRVMTSGDGGVIPRGLPVGSIVKGLEGWRVALDADAAPIDFVRILLFRDFTQLAPPPPVAVLPGLKTAAPEPKVAPMAAPVKAGKTP